MGTWILFSLFLFLFRVWKNLEREGRSTTWWRWRDESFRGPFVTGAADGGWRTGIRRSVSGGRRTGNLEAVLDSPSVPLTVQTPNPTPSPTTIGEPSATVSPPVISALFSTWGANPHLHLYSPDRTRDPRGPRRPGPLLLPGHPGPSLVEYPVFLFVSHRRTSVPL